MSENQHVQAAWGRIEVCLKQNAGAVYKSLKPGAVEADLQAVGAKLGAVLPNDLLESYRIHDAGKRVFPAISVNDMAYTIIPAKKILREYRPATPESVNADANMISVSDGVQREYWHAGWIPFASNGGGDYLCVDLAPAEGGSAGQVIEVIHETLQREKRAASLGEFLLAIADRLERGVYFYDTENGIVHAGESGAGLATAETIRADSTYVLTKTTKTGIEYYMKRVATYEDAKKEPPNRVICTEQDGLYYVVFALKGEKTVPVNSGALDRLNVQYDNAVKAKG